MNKMEHCKWEWEVMELDGHVGTLRKPTTQSKAGIPQEEAGSTVSCSHSDEWRLINITGFLHFP